MSALLSTLTDGAAWDAWTGLGAPRALLWALVAAIVPCVGLGVVVGYHRVLTHRAAKLHPLVEKALVTFALPAGTPVQWIGNHRRHHAVADTPEDVHSPVVHGFWVAHCGWYLGTRSAALCAVYAVAGPLRTLFDAWWRPRTNQEHARLAADVAKDPYYAWLSTKRGYGAALLAYLALLWVPVVVLFGGFGALVLYFVHLSAYTLGDFVNSLGHGAGGKSFACDDDSRDSALLALATFGDGYHNGHHAFPYSARAGLLPGQIDVAHAFLAALARLGLAEQLRRPTDDDVKKHLLTRAARPLEAG